MEVLPRKTRSLAPEEASLLASRLDDEDDAAMAALLEGSRWAGLPQHAIPHRLGVSPRRVSEATEKLLAEGIGAKVDAHLFSVTIWRLGGERVLRTLSKFHEDHPLRPGMPLQELRQVFPTGAGPGLGEAIIQRLFEEKELVLGKGLARLPAFSPRLSKDQARVREGLQTTLLKAGLSPPGLKELATGMEADPGETEKILRLMETEGEVLCLEGGLFFHRNAVGGGAARVVSALGGRSGLGPADFREVLGVTRKYLLPLLRYMDTVGITTRIDENRSVSESLPEGWGTSAPPPL